MANEPDFGMEAHQRVLYRDEKGAPDYIVGPGLREALDKALEGQCVQFPLPTLEAEWFSFQAQLCELALAAIAAKVDRGGVFQVLGWTIRLEPPPTSGGQDVRK